MKAKTQEHMRERKKEKERDRQRERNRQSERQIDLTEVATTEEHNKNKLQEQVMQKIRKRPTAAEAS